MAYNITGTNGNDNIDQAADTGPGSILGLAGNDTIHTGTGAVTVDGGSGDDTIILKAGNTGQVVAGTENDSIWDQGQNIGSMLLFGNEGADTVNVFNSTNAQTIVGGIDSSDGSDLIMSGSGADLLFGNGGADSLYAGLGNDTYVGGFGDDRIIDPTAGGSDLVLGNEGNDYINVWGGNDTVVAGKGDDSVIVSGADHPLYLLSEGNDTINAESATGAMTIVGGNDSSDGNDSIRSGAGDDLIFGNGGNDTIRDAGGNNTVVAGAGNDSIQCTTAGTDIILANEGDDTVGSASGQDTVVGGLGNDQITGGADGGQMLIGSEGNDTLLGLLGIDTLTGGSGADVFRYLTGAGEDGDNANAGGPVERITDVNFDEDRFQVMQTVGYAANIGAVNSGNLEASAESAIQAVLALGGGGAQHVAAQFTFNGRDYLAIDQGGLNNLFTDAFDLLLDITGSTGTIGANDFFV